MSVVSLLGVNFLNNPAAFGAPYELEITFECLEQLQKGNDVLTIAYWETNLTRKQDLEWKLTYVGSATSSEHDQELDSLLVGPIPVGVNKFIFEADAPDLKRIPSSDVLGVTVILLTCSYDGREFVRVGYYVNNEYDSEELNKEPPAKPVMDRVKRNVLAEKPRVTRFTIKWDTDDSAPAEFPPDQPEADLVEDDGTAYGAEEEEEEEELVEAPAEGADSKEATGEDVEMGGADENAVAKDPAAEKEDEEGSDDGSEDLEAESSGSEEDDVEEEEGEGDGDEDMEMGEDAGEKATNGNAESGQPVQAHQETVMAH
ncbi:MAG: Histone chaperone asf1 [Chaenotheca gracillima]|nr:MAG: Histone chaperone asf1 [Chaenotheca gracillima]